MKKRNGVSGSYHVEHTHTLTKHIRRNNKKTWRAKLYHFIYSSFFGFFPFLRWLSQRCIKIWLFQPEAKKKKNEWERKKFWNQSILTFESWNEQRKNRRSTGVRKFILADSFFVWTYDFQLTFKGFESLDRLSVSISWNLPQKFQKRFSLTLFFSSLQFTIMRKCFVVLSVLWMNYVRFFFRLYFVSLLFVYCGR